MIYLDNASTTRKKPNCVIKTIKKEFKKYSVNSGRGGYALSLESNLKIFELREKVCELFNFNKPENVILTSGCTSSINMCMIGTVKPNKHIIVTIYEHNSVLRTLHYLSKEYNVTYSVAKPNNEGIITSKEIEKLVRKDTYLVIVNHSSNVTGVTNDIHSIGKLCKNLNLKFMVDCAQSAGHTKINVLDDNINLLAFAGHKGLLGPQGIGGFIVNNIDINPTKFGGTGTESEHITQPTTLPDGFESGTHSTINSVALLSSINYIIKNENKINKKINLLLNYLIKELEKINEIKIYSSKNNNIGVISFNIKNLSSSEVGNYLDENYNICVRTGLQCAPFVHKFYNTTLIGMVRVSLSHFNTIHELKKLIKALKVLINKSKN